MPTKKLDKTDIPWTSEAQQQDVERVHEMLRDVSGRRVTPESSVEYRLDDGLKIMLPANPTQMELEEGSRILAKEAEAKQETYVYNETFKCTPPDGAVGFYKLLQELYGRVPMAKGQRTMFGTTPPQMKKVAVGPKKKIDVPWGLVEFKKLEAEFHLDEVYDQEFGWAFRIHGACKKKYEGEVQGIFLLLADYLEKNSIYRGVALHGVGRSDGTGYQDPTFLNIYGLDRDDIVYNTETFNSLWHGLWGRIKHLELLKSIGQKFNMKNLLAGPPGTGKTAGLLVTAQLCVEEEITFIQAKWDENLDLVLKFAEHVGGPCVVAVEDIEKVVERDNQAMDRLLEMFDGMQTKGREVSLLLTSNKPGVLPQRLLRPGRIDRMIEIGDFDSEALRRLIDRKIPEAQRGNELDYDLLAQKFKGFKPSWVVQVLNNALVGSVIRTGKTEQPLVTDDFIQEAEALRPQFELFSEAGEPKALPTLDQVVADIITKRVVAALQGHMVDLGDGEIMRREGVSVTA